MDNKQNTNNKMGKQLNMDDLEKVTGGGMRTEESYEQPEEDDWYDIEGNEWILLD